MKDDSSAIATDEELRSRSREVDWYNKELDSVPDAAREVLEKYSKIPPEKVKDHVYAIREKAWDIWPYPCIGGFRFVDLNLCTTAQYPEILERLKHGEKLLDLGCCFGQEMRKLILDGAPPENLFGTDLRQDFFDLGYDLFLDRETFKSTFIAADIFEPSPQLEAVNGKVSFVYAGAFFHLFDRPEQLQIAKRMASLLSTQPGSMVLGRQVGNVNPGRYEHKTNSDGFMFRHDEQSWKELWEEAGRETDTKWDVWVELVMRSRFMVPGQNQTGARQMNFCVKRV